MFSGFYKYGILVKTGSRKYGRNTSFPTSQPIYIFVRKYENRRKKFKNTDGTERDFIRPFSSLRLRALMTMCDRDFGSIRRSMPAT